MAALVLWPCVLASMTLQGPATAADATTPAGVSRAAVAAKGSRPTPGSRTATATRSRFSHPASRPSGETLAFENIEGILLVRATAHGIGRDTSGVFALDTGAGFFAIDHELSQILGIDSTAISSDPIRLARTPLPRLEIGRMQFDQVQPILLIDANIIRQVSGRPVLGLLGARLLERYALDIDYLNSRVTWIDVSQDGAGDPGGDSVSASRRALGDGLDRSAMPMPFRIAGDGKILVPALVTNLGSRMGDSLTLVLDTGATKTALFAHALATKAPAFERWPALRGLSAPTLIGSADARLARVRALVVGRGASFARGTEVDVAVLDSPLEAALSAEVDEPVDGLLGYSFLRRFGVVIDYPHRVLWLTPRPHSYDERPYEYSHVGLQIERRGDALRVIGVATHSPADIAGIRADDELAAIDGISVQALDVIDATLRLEGPPGTAVVLTMRREDQQRTYRLIRRRLL